MSLPLSIKQLEPLSLSYWEKSDSPKESEPCYPYSFLAPNVYACQRDAEDTSHEIEQVPIEMSAYSGVEPPKWHILADKLFLSFSLRPDKGENKYHTCFHSLETMETERQGDSKAIKSSIGVPQQESDSGMRVYQGLDAQIEALRAELAAEKKERQKLADIVVIHQSNWASVPKGDNTSQPGDTYPKRDEEPAWCKEISKVNKTLSTAVRVLSTELSKSQQVLNCLPEMLDELKQTRTEREMNKLKVDEELSRLRHEQDDERRSSANLIAKLRRELDGANDENVRKSKLLDVIRAELAAVQRNRDNEKIRLERRLESLQKALSNKTREAEFERKMRLEEVEYWREEFEAEQRSNERFRSQSSVEDDLEDDFGSCEMSYAESSFGVPQDHSPVKPCARLLSDRPGSPPVAENKPITGPPEQPDIRKELELLVDRIVKAKNAAKIAATSISSERVETQDRVPVLGQWCNSPGYSSAEVEDMEYDGDDNISF